MMLMGVLFMYIPLTTMLFVLAEFEKRLAGYSVKKFKTTDDLINVYLIDDSLAILVELVGYRAHLCCNPEEMYGHYRNNPFLEYPVEGKTYYSLRIEELTPNEIGFKYNNTKFINDIKSITNAFVFDIAISYSKYDSDRKSYWIYRAPNIEPDANIRINSLFPELKLQDRCAAWKGKLYYFVVLEFEDVNGFISRACGYSTTKPHSYVVGICKEWIRTGKLKGTACSTSNIEEGIGKAFDSWKGIKRQQRLEEHLKYFYVERYFKNHFNLLSYALKVLSEANEGVYDNEERSTYLRPVNKWISEELVYNITKRYYGKKYPVIYQHRPFFLRSEKDGQMSYDVFISGINVAIEYQGKQHFEPVEFFGGQRAYENLQKRDQLKAKLSIENGVRLVYINYWEEITPDLIIKRVGIDIRGK